MQRVFDRLELARVVDCLRRSMHEQRYVGGRKTVHHVLTPRLTLGKFSPDNRRASMESANELVYVMDDDSRVREALSGLLRANGRNVEAISSGGEFLDTPHRNVVSCLILDLRMPGMNGLEADQQISCTPRESERFRMLRQQIMKSKDVKRNDCAVAVRCAIVRRPLIQGISRTRLFP
jgi:CheY-like chemotaxis protein